MFFKLSVKVVRVAICLYLTPKYVKLYRALIKHLAVSISCSTNLNATDNSFNPN